MYFVFVQSIFEYIFTKSIWVWNNYTIHQAHWRDKKNLRKNLEARCLVGYDVAKQDNTVHRLLRHAKTRSKWWGNSQTINFCVGGYYIILKSMNSI
jgi:hypothetical protein